MPGNRLGPRAWYRYVADDGEVYAIYTDVDLGEAAGLTAALIGTPEKPSRLVPRYVVLRSQAGTLTGKRMIVNVDNDIFINGGVATIDGEAFLATGRVGEKKSFPRLATPGP